MAYPPAVPQPNITNATAQADRHPADHNAILEALASIITELGNNPKGDAASLTARLSGFAVVDGVLRDANAAWGVQQGWQVSKNGNPSQTFPPGSPVDVVAAGIAPVTGSIKAGRLYRIEGMLTVQGQNAGGGQSYVWSLMRDNALVVQGAVGPLPYGLVTSLPIMVYQRVNGADLLAGNHTYKFQIQCDATTGKIQHPCVMAVADVGADVPGATATSRGEFSLPDEA